jgi:hypothetical protein
MQPLSRAIKKLFGIQYLLCFLVLLLEMSFAQFLCAGTVSELDLGLTAKGASPLTAAEARSAKMAEELDLGIGPDLIAKHGGGGGGRGRGGWDRSFSQAQADLRKHEAAEAADQAATDREMAEAEAMIADAQRDMGGRVPSRGSRSTPAIGNQTQNVVPGLHDPAEAPHVRTGTGGSSRSRGSRYTSTHNDLNRVPRVYDYHNPREEPHVPPSRKTPPVGKPIDNRRGTNIAAIGPVTERRRWVTRYTDAEQTIATVQDSIVIPEDLLTDICGPSRPMPRLHPPQADFMPFAADLHGDLDRVIKANQNEICWENIAAAVEKWRRDMRQAQRRIDEIDRMTKKPSHTSSWPHSSQRR